jgi:hypothetical protein
MANFNGCADFFVFSDFAAPFVPIRAMSNRLERRQPQKLPVSPVAVSR